ncbi:type II toxin-antitoxin system RelE/ParE family toxin [Mycetocola lacteus]|uniref:Type II toxin-antitoxin system RelE/ParE family toxin n=1 Tax=Mycetocola lacteus TaxID=76637 RepID=A0A3L7AHF8_9MICO|nr:type II toxin-antitoxin system RelE/ParE family toxin [Mycetocola lacteus]RLP79375.1 type II toxin-antitoxin system RelE/ParE family toxin [Mycetocola lacteus]
MAVYRISYASSAAKAFRGIHPRDRQPIRDAIERLAEDPRPVGSIKLVGGAGERRVRVGNYRVVYDVDDGVLVVLILRIGNRRDVYRM